MLQVSSEDLCIKSISGNISGPQSQSLPQHRVMSSVIYWNGQTRNKTRITLLLLPIGLGSAAICLGKTKLKMSNIRSRTENYIYLDHKPYKSEWFLSSHLRNYHNSKQITSGCAGKLRLRLVKANVSSEIKSPLQWELPVWPMAMVVDTRASVVAPPVSSEGPALGPVTTYLVST